MNSWHMEILWALLGQPWVWLLGMEALNLTKYVYLVQHLRYLTSPSARPALIWILPGLWPWSKLFFWVLNWDYYFFPTVFPHSFIHSFICACIWCSWVVRVWVHMYHAAHVRRQLWYCLGPHLPPCLRQSLSLIHSFWEFSHLCLSPSH